MPTLVLRKEQALTGEEVLLYMAKSHLDITAISISHDIHRIVRAPMNPFFSRSGLRRVEYKVVERVRKLCLRLESEANTGNPVNFNDAFASLATDVASAIFHEEPSNFLEDEKFNARWWEILRMGLTTVPLLVELPWIARAITTPVIKLLTERLTNWRIWDDKSRRQIQITRTRPSATAKTRSDRTVMDSLVHDTQVTSILGEKGFVRLSQLIQQAGTHNVSKTLAIIVYFLLRHEDQQEALRRALEPLFAGDAAQAAPSLQQMERVPYLTACIKEGLRLAAGSLNRFPRVSPDAELSFKDWTIPKGTAVSMTPYWIHMDPEVFPDPGSFNPSRWLADPAKLATMHRHFVPFSKGSRACLGKE
ncbi:cytochrome P450 [Penicillium soppii]|uniref:cytochrome P450 n=1 Tax=Penicillium soppii TaxID=69789 RepID=UPI0025494C6D|nr:cytochrome P450 [Penicillium soppii]KAJ5860070.1 cytochrome P450 [Penicillium soppii]